MDRFHLFYGAITLSADETARSKSRSGASGAEGSGLRLQVSLPPAMALGKGMAGTGGRQVRN